MYTYLEIILSPIIFLIEKYYLLLVSTLTLPGLSIILLSLSISIILIPFLRIARIYEDKINLKINFIENNVKEIPSSYKGEERFRAIEKIYEENSFHPIQNISRGLSLYLILPVLISAYIFFINNNNIFDVEVLGMINLSEPDKLIKGINVLPILIFFINYLDSTFRYSKIASGQNIYLFMSFAICVLIYSMPSCMTLYWATSSMFSLLFNIKSK